MSFLRNRFGGGKDNSSADVSRDPTPDPDRPQVLRVVTEEKLNTLKKRPKPSKRRSFWTFGLGGVFGLVVAAFFAQSNDMIDLSGLENVNLESLLEVLPAGLVQDAKKLQVC